MRAGSATLARWPGSGLIRCKEHPAPKLVGLDIDSNAKGGHGDCVHIGRAQVDEVTSAMRSPLLGKTVPLARVDVACSEIGTEVKIGTLDRHQKRLPARIVPFTHYNPQKERHQS